MFIPCTSPLGCFVFAVLGVSVSASQCAGGLYSVLANEIAAFTPAQVYCSSRYPLAPVTLTVTASTATITSVLINTTTSISTTTFITTATPATLTDTVATSTFTTPITTQTTSTLTSTTETDTVDPVSTTTTITPPSFGNKRRAVSTLSSKSFSASISKLTTTIIDATLKTSTTTASAQGSQASVWSSLLNAASFVESVCACLETPSTSTVTTTPSTTLRISTVVTASTLLVSSITTIPTVITSVTATSTSDVTDLVINTITTITTTTTTAATSIATQSLNCQWNERFYMMANGVTAGVVSEEDATIMFNGGNTEFILDSNCDLVNPAVNYIGNLQNPSSLSVITFNYYTEVPTYQQVCRCAFDDTNAMYCNCDGNTVFSQDSDGVLYISDDAADAYQSGYSPISITAVFIS